MIMGFLKRIHWLYLASSLVLIALGVVCVSNPAFIATVICYVAGVLLLIFGIGKVIRYFASRNAFVDTLVLGVLFGMIGFILITKPDQVLNLIFIFIGILILLDGIIKLKNSFVARAGGSRDWIGLLIVAVIVMAFGVIIIANPFGGLVPIIILGVGVILDGLQNAYSAFRGVLPLQKKAEDKPMVQKNVSVDDYNVDEG